MLLRVFSGWNDVLRHISAVLKHGLLRFEEWVHDLKRTTAMKSYVLIWRTGAIRKVVEDMDARKILKEMVVFAVVINQMKKWNKIRCMWDRWWKNTVFVAVQQRQILLVNKIWRIWHQLTLARINKRIRFQRILTGRRVFSAWKTEWKMNIHRTQRLHSRKCTLKVWKGWKNTTLVSRTCEAEKIMLCLGKRCRYCTRTVLLRWVSST